MSAPTPDFAATIRARIRHAQNRTAAALGVDESRRALTVLAMHETNARRAPGYWIQLFLSMGIATFGLVLGSTAVVIGAMLVSPLMGPIVELGMGFAVGSSLLVLRASLRIALSIVVVIAGAALFTIALPFHEITPEIAARATPTALDLLVAIFCALTAAYTTVRPGADSTAAAAGTAIGIALVPPLCAAGFGLGAGSLDVAGGAILLFTANLSAILVFAVLSFLLLGFDQVDAVAVETRFLDEGRADRAAARAHAVLRNLFGSRYGLAMRLLIPGVFLAGVYLPLSRALDEVTWEVRTRDAIRQIVSAESPGAVQTAVVVERHAVALRLILVGSTEKATALEQQLVGRIAAVSGVVPNISVVSVPDAQQLAATAAAQARPGVAPSGIALQDLSSRIGSAVTAAWPRVAGPVIGWEVRLLPKGPPTVIVRHIGAPLDEPALAVMSTLFTARLGTEIGVRTAALSPTAITSRPGRNASWADSARMLIAQTLPTDSVAVCVWSPATRDSGRLADRDLLRQLLASDSATRRMRIVSRGPWKIQLAASQCASPVAPRQNSPGR